MGLRRRRFVSRPAARRIGFAARPDRGAVSRASELRKPPIDRPLEQAPGWASTLAPLQSSFVSSPAPLLSKRRPPTGVSFLIAASSGASTEREASQNPRYVPPSGFLDLSAVSSALRLRGFVAPRSHVQDFSVQGVCLSAQPPSLVGKSVPPCRWTSCRSPPEGSCHDRGPRLRGLPPRGAAFRPADLGSAEAKPSAPLASGPPRAFAQDRSSARETDSTRLRRPWARYELAARS